MANHQLHRYQQHQINNIIIIITTKITIASVLLHYHSNYCHMTLYYYDLEKLLLKQYFVSILVWLQHTATTYNIASRLILAPSQIQQVCEVLTTVSCCLSSKYLDFNATKCCYLLLSQKRTYSIHPPMLMLNDVPIKRVSSYKYLGVGVGKLCWHNFENNRYV